MKLLLALIMLLVSLLFASFGCSNAAVNSAIQETSTDDQLTTSEQSPNTTEEMTGDLKLKSCSISGQVYDAGDHKPIVGAVVHAFGLHGIVDGCPQTRTITGGSYKITGLNEGETTLLVVADGYIPQYYIGVYEKDKSAKVITKFGEDTPNINFALEYGGSISGYVTRTDLNIHAGHVAVCWRQLSGTPTPDPTACSSEVGRPYCVLTNDDGSYTIGGLFTGDYALSVYPWQHVDSAHATTITVSVIQGKTTSGADLTFNIYSR